MPKTAKKVSSLKRAEARLRETALDYPQTEEAHPWGETAIKVKGKTFLFMRLTPEELSFSVKLPKSGIQALALPFVKPLEYGMGKHGWVKVTVSNVTKALEEQFLEWLDESFRAVAPKKVLDALDTK